MELVEAAMNSGPHQGITLLNGDYHEGHILDCGADWLEFGDGGPLADYTKTSRYQESEIKCIWYSVGPEYVCRRLSER